VSHGLDLSQPAFEFSGGDLSLDFANSWSDRSRPESDRLGTYDALLAWCWQAGLLAPPEAESLSTAAARSPAAAASAVDSARALREALFALFAGAARREPAREPAVELETLNAWLQRDLGTRELAPAAEGFAWRWRPAPADALLAPLRPVALAAAELLASDRLARVRECDASNCSWLFLDRSRAGSRRWCSMESCGNRAKARRHYRRRAATG
jgi:predicted RNA-binding Zn ribbon-like protein